MILVDTSVWSLALRRRQNSDEPVVVEFSRLVYESQIQMIGPIRQELLSGIQSEGQFTGLRDHLHAYRDLVLEENSYERAAECFNICRSKGVQGSFTDFLICAVGEINDLPIFTVDSDFDRFAEHLPIALHRVAR